jgi:hypothetical protein
MAEDFRFNPWLIADPPPWLLVGQVIQSSAPATDKNAAAKIQLTLVRETLAAQLKAIEAAARVIGLDFDKV